MRWGALIFVIGIVVSVVSFAQAGPGRTFVVAIGALIAGAGRFLYGLANNH
jgi:hypothetical protein